MISLNTNHRVIVFPFFFFSPEHILLISGLKKLVSENYKKICDKVLREKRLMFVSKCGLRISILHIILPTREQYKNKHTMLYIIQSVNLQTQTNQHCSVVSLQSFREEEEEEWGRDGFRYFNMPFHVLKSL